MLKFNRGCTIDTGDLSTGGGADPAPTETPAETPAATSVDATPEQTPKPADQEVQREDFSKAAPFLRKYQTSSESEPAAPAKEGEAPDKPTGEPVKTEEPTKAEPQVPNVYELPDGRKVSYEQLVEWEKGHMMQSDYTKKTQALAERHRQIEQQYGPYAQHKENYDKAMALWQNMARDPVGTLNKLQEHYAEQGIFEPKDPAVLQQEDLARQLQFEKQQLMQEKASLAAAQKDRAIKDARSSLEAQLSELAKAHGDLFDRDEVLKFMVDNNLFDPEKAFNAVAAPKLQEKIAALKTKEKTIKDSAVNEYVKAKTSKAAASLPVGAAGGGGAPVSTITPAKSFQDARKAAMARLGGTGG